MAELYGWIEGLIKGAGVKADDPKLAELKEKLGDFDIGGENQTFLNQNVMLKEAAKNNSEIASHHIAKYRANFGYKVDAAIYKSLEDAGISPEEIAEFKTSYKDKTIEAVSGLYDKIRAQHQKALDDLPKGAGKDEINKIKDSYQKQIDELNQSVLSKQEEISKQKQAHEDELINMELSRMISSMDYSNKYEKAHAIYLAERLLQDQLKKDNIKVVRDTDGIKLKMNDETGGDFYQNNQRVTPDDYVKNIVSNNNLLKAANEPVINPIGLEMDEKAIKDGAVIQKQMLEEI